MSGMTAINYVHDTNIVTPIQYEQHMNLYRNYVNKVNEIDELLSKLKDEDYIKSNGTYSYFRGLKQGESFAIDAVQLHEYYFENLGKLGVKIRPSEKLQTNVFNKYWGSFDNWKKDFIATCKASQGWAMLCWNPRTQSFRNVTLDAHNIGGLFFSPVLIVADLYQHAYFIDYGSDVGKYIDIMVNSLDWNVISNRFK